MGDDGHVPVDRVARHSLSCVAGVACVLGVSEVGRTDDSSWCFLAIVFVSFLEALVVSTFITPFRKQTSPNHSSSKRQTQLTKEIQVET